MNANDFSDQHRPLAQQLIDAGRAIDDLLSGLTPEQLAHRPDPAKWSVGEVIEHLTITNIEYIGSLDAALGRARKRTTDKPYRYGIIGSFFLSMMEPPVKRRLPAPKKFLPPIGKLGDVAADFRATQTRLLELLRKYDDRDLTSTSLPSPAAKFLRFNAAAAFAILASHERRHIWQAERVASGAGASGPRES